MSLTLYNTMTRSKQLFQPIDPARVTLYVCGPTVYNRVHIGNARPAVIFDTLYRLLNTLYPKVVYARNITDIDDKIMATAAELGEEISSVSQRYAEAYVDDMAALNNLAPTVVPYATDHIPEMIDMVSRLVAKGHAYAVDNGVEGEQGHVLFAVQSMRDYGSLSRRSLDDMLAGLESRSLPTKNTPETLCCGSPPLIMSRVGTVPGVAADQGGTSSARR